MLVRVLHKPRYKLYAGRMLSWGTSWVGHHPSLGYFQGSSRARAGSDPRRLPRGPAPIAATKNAEREFRGGRRGAGTHVPLKCASNSYFSPSERSFAEICKVSVGTSPEDAPDPLRTGAPPVAPRKSQPRPNENDRKRSALLSYLPPHLTAARRPPPPRPSTGSARRALSAAPRSCCSAPDTCNKQ